MAAASGAASGEVNPPSSSERDGIPGEQHGIVPMARQVSPVSPRMPMGTPPQMTRLSLGQFRGLANSARSCPHESERDGTPQLDNGIVPTISKQPMVRQVSPQSAQSMPISPRSGPGYITSKQPMVRQVSPQSAQSMPISPRSGTGSQMLSSRASSSRISSLTRSILERQTSTSSSRRGIMQMRESGGSQESLPIEELAPESDTESWFLSPRQKEGLAAALDVNAPYTCGAGMPSSSGFLVRCDRSSVLGSRLISLCCFVVAAALMEAAAITVPKKSHIGIASISLCVGALCFLLMALSLVFRVRTPTSLYMVPINGTWCLTLERRAVSPVVRKLTDLEGFVESFGSCTQCKLGFWGMRVKRVGFSTSRLGAVTLFFERSSSDGEVAMCVSLQEPLAFFTSLRDVMIATSHPLAATTAEYVADWE